MPSAFDEAGIRMLDSIREIFDIIRYEFEWVEFKLIEYKNFEDLAYAINEGKCPVADVLREHIYPNEKGGSHVMVGTGIKDQNGVKCIQLKNSYADNPNEQGKVCFTFRSLANRFQSSIIDVRSNGFFSNSFFSNSQPLSD